MNATRRRSFFSPLPLPPSPNGQGRGARAIWVQADLARHDAKPDNWLILLANTKAPRLAQ